MKKRLLSALLALVMVLALLPASVFAAEAKDAVAAKVEMSVTLPTSGVADGDKVTIATPSGTDSKLAFSAVFTAAVTDGNTTWSVASSAGSNFNAEYNGGKLTLTAATAGALEPKATDFGTLEVSIADGSGNTKTDYTVTAPTIADAGITKGEDAVPATPDEGGGDGKDDDFTTPDFDYPKTDGTVSGAQDGWKAVYQKTNIATTDKTNGVGSAPGWYVYETKDNYTTYKRINSGFVVSSKWYANTATLPTSYSTITVFGNSVSVPAKGNKLTVDVYPNGSTLTNLSVYGGNILTDLTVKDSSFAAERRESSESKAKVSVSVSGWIATNDKAATLTLTDVDASAITMPSDGYNHTVNLENCKVTGNITMNGFRSDSKGKLLSAQQTLTIGKSASSSKASEVEGTITVKGNGANVTLRDAKVTGLVTLEGGNTKLLVSGTSDVNSVKIDEGDRYTANQALTTITVDATFAKVGAISFVNSNVTGKATISVTAGTVGAIDMKGIKATPDIRVSNGQTGKIEVEAGTVNVSGTYANIAGLELGGGASFTMTGTNHTVTGLLAKTGNVKISVPADLSNTLKMESKTALDLYRGHGIQGGTWLEFPVPAGALHSSLVYQLNLTKVPDGNGSYTYHNYDQLNQALVSQFKNAGSDGTGSDAVLTGVGQVFDTTDTSKYYKLQFKNGKTLWGTMLVSGEMQIKLPTLINTVSVNNWADSFHSDRPAGYMYSTPSLEVVNANTDAAAGEAHVWELNASGGLTSGDVTKITDIAVKSTWPDSFYVGINDKMGDVKATLSGNVISLSGAVPAGTSHMKLYLTTDAIESKSGKEKAAGDEDVPVTIEVPVTYFSNNGSLVFSSVPNDSLRRGVTVQFNENTNGVLRLSNGTKYTLNGSGLKERAENITVLDSATDKDIFAHNFIEVNVNVSTINTDPGRKMVADLLNGSNAKFDWQSSPAIREAVNAALATISPTTVDNWIKTARTNAWKTFNGTPSASDLEKTGYDKAYLVPYLQVNVTAYDPNGTLTATLVPSYRVEVRQVTEPADKRLGTAFADPKTGNPGNVYVAARGTLSLGSNVSEIVKDSFDKLDKGVTVKFSGESGLLFNDLATPIYMHQDNTYAYKQDSNGFLIKHNGGTSLGTVTINTTVPLVKLYDDKTADPVAYFDTLQAAVNDAQDKQHIDIDQNYKGSLSVSVTGYARTFTIQANGQNVVLANASGALTIQNNTGSEYTVQLGRNSTAVVDPGSVSIAVARVTGGTATVNATTAKVGATVTVTCTPAAGYRTSLVTASAHMTQNNTNVAVTVTKVSDNVYTFKVPEGADSVTVTPAFVVGTAGAIPFSDVSTSHWAYNSVKYVYDNGLMNGVDTYGTVFGGNQNLTRAMVVTILYRAAGSPYVGTTSSLSDVANNTWYSQAVAWANQNGIVTGYADGTFHPNWNITRQELATILYRYNTNYKGRATTGSTTLANFPDQGNVSNWATAGMQWAVGNGIVNGITNGISTTLSPAGSATRYEAATMLMRYGQGLGL